MQPAVSRDEYGRYVFVDSAAEDVNTGGFRLINHSVCVAAHRSHSPSGTTIAALGKEIRYLAMVLLLGIDGGREACVRPNH